MKKWALLFGVMLIFAGIASAQDEFPKVEAFGGYSYLHVGVNNQNYTASFNGGSGSVAYNPTAVFGIVGDFGGYHWSKDGADATVVSYLFGPKVAFRHGKITPFLQTLFGGAYLSPSGGGLGAASRVHAEATTSGSPTYTNFAMALGGGVDYNLTEHIGVRLIQAEYVMTKFPDGLNNRQDNARVSVGVVVRF